MSFHTGKLGAEDPIKFHCFHFVPVFNAPNGGCGPMTNIFKFAFKTRNKGVYIYIHPMKIFKK